MPRRSGHRKGKCSRDRSFAGFFNQADIKLGDFADNPAAKLPARVSKKAYKIKYDKMHSPEMSKENQSPVTSKLTTREMPDSKAGKDESSDDDRREEDLAWDERDWDEKDLSEFENNAQSSYRESDTNAFEEEDEEDQDLVQLRGKKGSKKKSKKKLQQPTDEGTVYPADLWYILANYIRPQQVATFSCLCKAAYSVTKMASFWRNLYHRYFNIGAQLPYHLQPPRTKRNLCLRALVIRSLYIMYEPYRRVISVPFPVGEGQTSPDTIANYTCLYTWSQGKVGTHFTHFMKLRLCGKVPAIPVSCTYYDPDVHVNDNRRECVLRVHCEHFQDIPSAKIMGLQVVRASASVSANMRHHKLKLVFGRLDRRGSYVRSSLVNVFLDPVVKVEVLHWWHPKFWESSQPFIDRAVAENAANRRENNVWEGL